MRSASRAQGCACTAMLLLAVSGAGKLDHKAAKSLIALIPVGVCPLSPGRPGNLRRKVACTKAENPKAVN